MTHATLTSPPVSAPGDGTKTYRKGWLTAIVAVVLLLIFFALQNGYWVRGSDSEVYLGIARNLARGDGYRFNGQPVVSVPPGWPLLLAGAMKISTSFTFLKLLPLSFMAGGLILMLCALGRLFSPALAIVAVLVTALLQSVFQLTYWFHAEGLFMVLAGGTLLLAAQINQGRREVWRIAILAALCGLSLTARSAGLLWFGVVAGVLLRGELWPRGNRLWIATAVCGLATLATFASLRAILRVDQSQIDPRFDGSLSGAYDLVNAPQPGDTLHDRILDTDQWFCNLFWPLNATMPKGRTTHRVMGCMLLALCILTLVVAFGRREWTWLGVAAYVSALCLNWPQPVGRYLVPIAPLVIVAMMKGIEDVARVLGSWQNGARLALQVVVMLVILAPNLKAYWSDFRIMHSRDFYGSYRGGTDAGLVAAGQWLRDNGLRDGELVVSRRFATPTVENMGNGWMRSAHLLTGAAVQTIPDNLTRDPDEKMFRWVSDHGGLYYLYQPRVWIVEHERFYRYKQYTVTDEQMEWQLYQVHDGSAHRVELKLPPTPVTNVPGL